MKLLVVANWKMNPVTLKGAKLLFNSVKKGIKDVKKVEVIICPPFIWLSYLLNSKPYTSNPKLGAQNCFWEQKGAFTGEISPKMLKDLGIKYVIIGHSERRKYFRETNEMISKKLKAVLKAGLKPILCIDKLSQVEEGLKEVSKKDLKKLILAYEPVWAIGTGKSCSIEKAKKMSLVIKGINGKIPILYGGSVNSQNAKDYIEKAGFQGLLIGGASLDAKEFIKIIKQFAETGSPQIVDIMKKNC